PPTRPPRGGAAATRADSASVTDDNPRSEDPAAIRAQVRAGAPEAQDIGDRREAIAAAVALMREGDVLVVAGKGHEQFQTIAGVTHHFDDVAVTAQALESVHV
ncbi:MAG: UDP-N-acetylmuramoyl-L-alanyl-D-glutamate--2,6-diaminopimelate ligase, partial [Phenylobacterium sp.]|nr:UDP-N-acetylmuramoyl-L-alanyl-D-glutamate--2,6-diaminopimelate ligase [Phenylobacterium sp.]